MNEEKFEFGTQFQIDLLSLMTKSISFLLLCKRYVNVEYFSSDRLRFYCTNLYTYYNKYEKPPDLTFFQSIERDDKDKILTKKIFQKRLIREEFIKQKLKEFVQRSVFISMYSESGDLFNDGKIDNAFSVAMKGLEYINKIDFNSDRFEKVFADYKKRITEREIKLATGENFKIKHGIPQLDAVLRGGTGGGEITFWMGDAKSGKSFALTNDAVSAAMRYETVLYVILEGKREDNLARIDSCYLNEIRELVENNSISEEKHELMIKTMSRRSKRDIIVRNYNDWEGYTIADLERDYLELQNQNYGIRKVVIDYFDLMGAKKDGKFFSESDRQKALSRDLKTFAVKYNVSLSTATQTNRYIDKSDPNFLITSKNASEDYNKIRALDNLITINATEDEEKNGIRRLYIEMARNKPVKKVIKINCDLDRSKFYVKKEVEE